MKRMTAFTIAAAAVAAALGATDAGAAPGAGLDAALRGQDPLLQSVGNSSSNSSSNSSDDDDGDWGDDD